MNEKISSTLIIIICSLLLFPACRKDVVEATPKEISGTPLPGSTYCRIESMWESPRLPVYERFWIISYDEYENPTFMTSNRIGTGHPFKIFRYDYWHRLRELLGDYGNGFYEYWHFYGYDGNGRISVDTTYIFGRMGERPTNPENTHITHFEYDSQGRMKKAYGTSHGSIIFSETYEYNDAGNLIRHGVTYDNKKSLYRTNDIWMFLTRDYSMNNAFHADEYNAAGFPTFINNSSNPVGILDAGLNFSRISYSCRDSNYY